jgi:hypothetical protein
MFRGDGKLKGKINTALEEWRFPPNGVLYVSNHPYEAQPGLKTAKLG